MQCGMVGNFNSMTPGRFELNLRHNGHDELNLRHNGHDGISNHQPDDCLLNRLFRPRSNKTSKLHVTGLCVGNSLVTGEFPAQMANNVEIVSISWHHHETAYLSMFAGCVDFPFKHKYIVFVGNVRLWSGPHILVKGMQSSHLLCV